MAWQDYKDTVQKLYIAFYQRPGDPGGVRFWAQMLDAQGGSLEGIIDAFATSAEAVALYDTNGDGKLDGSDDLGKLVDSIYQALFNRAPDAAGKQFYLDALTNGEFPDGRPATPGRVALDILNGAQGSDLVTIANKVESANNFTNALDPDGDYLSPYTATYAGEEDAQKARDWLATVTADPTTIKYDGEVIDFIAQNIADAGDPVVETAQQGQTYVLTSNIDEITGTDKNDTFIGTDLTLTLDVIDGKGGVDTLKYNDTIGGQDINDLGLTLSNVEVIEGRSTGALSLTTTNFSDVTTVKALQGAATTVTASATQDVEVSGATGNISVDGGKNVSITDNTADTDITVGDTTTPAGNVTITDNDVGAGSIAVDGGVNVTISATGSSGGVDTITVGQGGAAGDLPTGTIEITSAHKATAGTDVTLNNITVSGGSTVSITQVADTSKAADDTTGATLTQGSVTVTAGDNTTSVTVKQAKSTAEVQAQPAVEAKYETVTVQFGALKAGDDLTVNGLTFKASKDLTANEVAAAFANLTAGATQGQSPYGVYTGAFDAGTANDATDDYTSSAADGDKVVFTAVTDGNKPNWTATTGGTGVINLTNTSGNSTQPTIVSIVDGVAAQDAVEGVLGVINGVVTINDNATASITDVVVDGYGGTSQIGNTGSLTKLQSLTLKNTGSSTIAGNQDASMTVDAAGVAALNLTVDNVANTVNLDGAADGALKRLTINATGEDSSFKLTAASLTDLTIDGTAALDLSATAEANLGNNTLKNVTIKGSGAVNLGTIITDDVGLDAFNASANTGGVTATVETDSTALTGGLAEYVFSAGNDNVTLESTAVDVKVTLGDGDDTVNLAAGTTSLGALISAGNGTDTISMDAADLDAVTTAATPTFQDNIDGFERVQVQDFRGQTNTYTINLDNFDKIAYVITDGGDGALNIDNLVSGGTVEIANRIDQLDIDIKDAANGASDEVSLVMTNKVDQHGNILGIGDGSVEISDVENINIVIDDNKPYEFEVGIDDTIFLHDLTLYANATKKITVSGEGGVLLLDLRNNEVLTELDASNMTSPLLGLMAATNGKSAMTIKGSQGMDILAALGDQDVLIGNDGDDWLHVINGADLVTLTGGVGRDIFFIQASDSANGYATITDLSSDDQIVFGAFEERLTESFDRTKVTLADTAVFQDYANAAVNAVGAGGATWFQYEGNTYVVADLGDDSMLFVNGEDAIVKIVGLVDLSTASFNIEHGSIQLAS